MERPGIAVLIVWVLALLAGCDSGEPSDNPTATVTVTATTTVTRTAERDRSDTGRARPSTQVLADLVSDEYTSPTLERLARTICEELRTGDRDRSFPWRQMIGYIGKERTRAFVAHSVGAYCPEQAASLVEGR